MAEAGGAAAARVDAACASATAARRAASTGLDYDSALFERDAVTHLTSLDDVGVRISAATVVSAYDWQVLGEASQLFDEISDVHGRTIAHGRFLCRSCRQIPICGKCKTASSLGSAYQEPRWPSGWRGFLRSETLAAVVGLTWTARLQSVHL